MLVVNIVTAICFALLCAQVLYVILNCVIKKRKERISFIRGFKRGKCALIFLVCIPLLTVGYVYGGLDVWNALLAAIPHVFDLVFLKFNLSKVSELINASLFYKITVNYACVLVIINAVLFVASLTGQRCWVWWQKIRINRVKKDKIYIFGNNADNLNVYNSAKSKYCVIVDDVSFETGTGLYLNKVRYVSNGDYGAEADKIFKFLQKNNKSITVIINTENDERNVRIGRHFAKRISESDENTQRRLFELLNIYVFGDPKYATVYDCIVTNSFGCVHYKNKYQMIAMDFIDRYPLSKFMDERHIDYKTSLIKPNVDINVCMVGFGKPNRQIFLTSVANNQFLRAEGNGVALKQVHYHIFDKLIAEHNKNLNHSYYRFKNECEYSFYNLKEYLPMPELPAHETYHRIDVNDVEFYNSIRKIVTAGKNDVNFIIVSFESDLENIDMMQKLAEKRREWGVENLVIFVRTKSITNSNFLLDKHNVYFIGNEKDCVYNIQKITNDKISRMAQMRNEIYDLEYKITHEKDFALTPDTWLDNRVAARRKWFKERTQLERDSNLYGCLSLQSKLNLMGLAYCKASENDLSALTEEEYINLYAVGDLPDTQTYGIEVDGKKVINYTLNFPQSKRKNLAIQEHYRWNSYMISRGIIPASKSQILNEQEVKNGKLKHTDGRNYRLRRHGNITTFDGLEEFRKMVSQRDGLSELECDVIKYDYQLLDDAYWLLSKNGYKIVFKRDLDKLQIQNGEAYDL